MHMSALGWAISELMCGSSLPQMTRAGTVISGLLAGLDALTYILGKKAGGKGKDSEKEMLKRQLQKEKRKKSIVSGSPGEETRSPGRPMSDVERLEEVIAERKKFLEERIS